MSNPGGGIQGDESPDELIYLEPSRADVHKENKSAGMLEEWKLPKIPTNKVYKTSRFTWQAKAKAFIDIAEGTIKVEGTEDNRVDITLLNEQKLRSLRLRNYRYVHLGLVQIGIVPLFGKGLDVPVIFAVCDWRSLKFRQALLGGMHTNLVNGPTWCKITPDFTVSLFDPSVELTIRVQTKGLKDQMRGCKNVGITYRVIYKVSNSFNQVALNTASSTEVFEPVPGTDLKFSRRQAEPRELQWPRSWVMDTPSGSSNQASVKDTPSGSSTQASVKEMLVLEEDGRVTPQILENRTVD